MVTGSYRVTLSNLLDDFEWVINDKGINEGGGELWFAKSVSNTHVKLVSFWTALVSVFGEIKLAL